MPHVTRTHRAAALLFSLGISSITLAGAPGSLADASHRENDEIVVGGQFIHTGTPVVLWTDAGGFDLTGLSRGTIRKPLATAGPTTTAILTPDAKEDPNTRIVRGPNVALDVLRENIDQFVIHFDVCGTSQECYRVLKRRRLSVQFMCDLDGTIYQTMDAGEASQHATKANTRSVGCEVANMGTFAGEGAIPESIRAWYPIENGFPRVAIPDAIEADALRAKKFVARPARPEPVPGVVQGKPLRQYDLTRDQYRALAQLTATLCSTLPKIQPDYPRFRAGLESKDTFTSPKPAQPGGELMTVIVPGSPTTRPDAIAAPNENGPLVPHALATAQYDAFQGVVGHYHVQLNKDDPGPAFQWVPLMTEVRKRMTPAARAACDAARGTPVGNGMLPPLVPPPG